MRLALRGETESSDSQASIARLALLPGLCCQAAGGDPAWADEVAAAWLMCYTAAHLFDSVEDQDKPDLWWANLGPGAAINVASGLLQSTPLVLSQLHQRKETQAVAVEVLVDFFINTLISGSGQHRDLVITQPSLTEWVEIASAKSGAPFALACRSGARLASADPIRLEAFSRFGRNLGMLIQVLDDLEDFRNLQDPTASALPPGLERSLPVVYSLEVGSSQIQERFQTALHASADFPQAANELIHLLDQCGAGLYLITEIERYKAGALTALEAATPEPGAGNMLSAYIHQIDPE
ncbi:MAG TPA: polyprenyl synthetase family protein [Anaerolineales bacterium]|nr:polyprenyl synthetase family protein [Anaerolineales bacterium]